MKINWKKIAPELVILGIFIVASTIYYWPVLEGKVVNAGDYINGRSAVQESHEYHEATGDYTYWTGNMFSGMPNYQVGGHGGYALDKLLYPIRWLLSWGNRNGLFIFLYFLIAFYLLLRTFKIERWLSLAGAFATAMSSYFFIIVAAGHNGKAYSITWMTIVLIGMILTYRKNYTWGALLIMFFTYIGFFQHPQMSYYMCMLMGVLFFAEIAIAVRDKEWKHFALATAIFFASFGIGMGMGSANIFANQEYANETMRGGHSDLAKVTDEKNKTEGLDLDYATAWSYGKGETMTFLIPNYMGGASGYNLGTDSRLYKDLVQARVPKSTAKQFCQSAPTYWGDKAFTSGPVYIGAIVCFLFLLGLMIVPGPYKWALLVATLFSLCLSWGKNMMWLTEFFFTYFPMYNKFRAVESILIVAEITMPLLAFLGLQKLVNDREKKGNRNGHYILIAGGVTAGVCLLFALFGENLCSFTSSYDRSWKDQVGNEIYRMILDQRAAMMTADAWRSLGFIAVATILLYIFVKKPFKTVYLGLAMTALVVLDMWPVDKRFCNDSVYVPEKTRDKVFQIQPWEEQILQDKDYYRVFNLTMNPFNDARSGYRLHSVGGYSAAKLRRYQDLIDEHLSRMNMNVYNMLNTRYFVVKGNNDAPRVEYNPEAFGNAWFVDSILVVNNANEESEALRTLDLRKVAVTDSTFAKYLSSRSSAKDESARVEFVSYTPKRLEYKTESQEEKVLVFSEIYYPYGWKATIDGKEAELFRVNYMLRAINVPSGDHKIVMIFDPDSVRKGNILSLSCFAVFLLSLIGSIGYYYFRKKKDEEA